MYIPFGVVSATFVAMMTLVPIGLLWASCRPDWGADRVARMSLRAKLPLPASGSERSIRARVRRLLRANMWTLLVALGVAGVVLVATPAGGSYSFLWLVALTILLGLFVTSAVVAVRERLFDPAPTAVRVARVGALRVEDYIGVWRTRVPLVILAAGAALLIIIMTLTVVGAVDTVHLGWAITATGVSAAAVLAAVWAERRVRAQPQPATDTVELAWDDVFRADALRTVRMGAAMAAWVGAGVSIAVLWRAGLPVETFTWDAVLGVFPWFGIPLIQVIYSADQGRLRDRLYPAWLRSSTQGAAA